ncbi:hypothetical protein SASPL_152552 [Salvia splendens]|uniref:Pentatricopeptide repeat-containing protein n=1 Tax=Salvia splendens TaxID=180675 RepID=A0A8X8W3D2_SALSN|nr:hypothetical protein SASPL_152552 [Salvia splendens]
MTLLYMYGKCGFLKDALQLFDEMSHRASIFTSHNHANLPQKTLFLYSAAASRGNLQPDDFIYATLFNACAGYNALKVGEQLHAQFIASSFADNDVVKSSLVDFYAKCGLPDRARSVFNSSRSYLRTPASFEECGHGRVKIRGAGGLAGGLEEAW